MDLIYSVGGHINWMDGHMNEWMDGQMNGWVGMSGCLSYGRTDSQINTEQVRYLDGSMDRFMIGWIDMDDWSNI